MAQYTVIHACGCEVTHRMNDKLILGERDNMVGLLSSQLCPECHQKEQLAKAQSESEAMFLPNLQGNDEQVTRAMLIRLALIKHTESMLVSTEWFRVKDKVTAEQIEQAKAYNEDLFNKMMDLYAGVLVRLGHLRRETSAKWFVQNRNPVVPVELQLGLEEPVSIFCKVNL